MTGTIINGIAIIIGGIVGLTASNLISTRIQARIKLVLAVFTLYVATSMVWKGLSGSVGHGLAQFGIGFLALILGNAAGILLRIQKGLNKFGQYAKSLMAKSEESDNKFSEGFITCSLLFCVGPMSILGAIEDGLNGDFKILALKGMMDGMATMGFTAMFGAGCILAVIPVVAYQGTISLFAGALEPYLSDTIRESISLTGGLLVVSIIVVILDVRKVPLANYLPALLIAPLLTHWWLE